MSTPTYDTTLYLISLPTRLGEVLRLRETVTFDAESVLSPAHRDTANVKLLAGKLADVVPSAASHDAMEGGVELKSAATGIQAAFIPETAVEVYSFDDRTKADTGLARMFQAMEQRTKSDPSCRSAEAARVFRAALNAAMADAIYKDGASATRTAPAQTVPVQTDSARTASLKTASDGPEGLEEAMAKELFGSGLDDQQPAGPRK
ncbi:uncharacterized protein MKK02DRAFT_39224 [Dioszegia hungarica]|uniref:Uncharacterized protein n=1 Tax=Dioszegia hungarica TaxID=4972 RepID=A0AA38H3T1_9TREE|nr:uncharacterized protein MKK02DRAFT_39224 [Dioszegia hungarica]KAI9633245.1 hypothetical protein MKK02DRAFT_39224 [Dioszegia hungarica]